MKSLAVAGGDDDIVDGMNEVGGWGFGRDVKFVGVALDELSTWLGTKEILSRAAVSSFAHGDDGIDQDGEVRATAFTLNGVGCFSFTQVVFGDGHGGEVASGGEANDANAVRLEVPIGGPHAGHPEGAFNIEKRAVWISFRKAVVENDTSDAVSVQPFGDGGTLALDDPCVTAARGDDEGGAIWLFRTKDGDGWIGIFKFAVAEGSFSFRPQFDRLRCIPS